MIGLNGTNEAINDTVALGMPIVGRRIGLGAIGSRISIPAGGRVPRGAPERRTPGIARGGAPTRNAPSVLANEAVSVLRAERSGHEHRSQVHLLHARRAPRPHSTVVPCQSAYRVY